MARLSAVLHLATCLLVWWAVVPARAAAGNDTERGTVDASISSIRPLKIPGGGAPDVRGTFIGEAFLAFIAPSGFVTIQYGPENNGDLTTTYGRFTSWQCIDAVSVPPPFRNMSVSRNVYDAVTYDMNGVVTSSGTFCNIYVVDVEQGRQWTTGSADGCPSVASIEANAFVQGTDSYINTQIVNATSIRQPSANELVCGPNAGVAPADPPASGGDGGDGGDGSSESPLVTPGPGLNVTSLPAVGTTIEGYPVSATSEFKFPPELSGESIALTTYNTTKTVASGENVELQVAVQTLQVSNGEGYVMIGLTSVNGMPQQFYSVNTRGRSYEYLNTTSAYVQTKSSVVFVDEDATVARYNPTSCTLVRLNSDVLSGYTTWSYPNASAVCPTVKDATERSNTTLLVEVTKVANFPAYGAVQPASALATGSGTSEDGESLFLLSIAPFPSADAASTVLYFNLNLTSADRVIGAEVRNQQGDKQVVVQLVPSASGWPTAVVGGNATLSSLKGPISGSYDLQGAFDLSGVELAEGGEYFVNVRSESPGGNARGALVWTPADGGEQPGGDEQSGGGDEQSGGGDEQSSSGGVGVGHFLFSLLVACLANMLP